MNEVDIIGIGMLMFGLSVGLSIGAWTVLVKRNQR